MAKPSTFTDRENRALRSALQRIAQGRSQADLGLILGCNQQNAGRLLRDAGFSRATAERLVRYAGFAGLDAFFAAHLRKAS